jgi:hypothetical protein
MLAYKQARKLFAEWDSIKDTTYDLFVARKKSSMYSTLNILMEDMNRSCNDYNRINNQTNLYRLITKYKKAKDYFDNYKYESTILGISNGSTIKQ